MGGERETRKVAKREICGKSRFRSFTRRTEEETEEGEAEGEGLGLEGVGVMLD